MSSHSTGEEDKPCRACSDFKSWAKNQHKVTFSPAAKLPKTTKTDCPLDRANLGKSTWGFLHTMASYFPDKPTKVQSEDMARFFNIFAQFYPCDFCAEDFRKDINENPPKTQSREELAKWLCDRHNVVNAKLGKPIFDCSTVHERWRDGWRDGSCL